MRKGGLWFRDQLDRGRGPTAVLNLLLAFSQARTSPVRVVGRTAGGHVHATGVAVFADCTASGFEPMNALAHTASPPDLCRMAKPSRVDGGGTRICPKCLRSNPSASGISMGTGAVQLTEGQTITLTGTIGGHTTLRTKAGKPFVKAPLETDGGETTTCLWWDSERAPDEGSRVTVEGQVRRYAGSTEVHVRDTRPLEDSKPRSREQRLLHYYIRLYEALLEAGVVTEPEKEVAGYRIDLAIESDSLKLAVECNGARDHKDKRKDGVRERKFRDAGWAVLNLDGRRIQRDLDGCVREVELAMKPETTS